ncbi:hypothetical protein NC651_009105 [Populus alba x Populus x berolinensis]|uniref:Uncharacterized protein n=1 Tax=Populus davidiana TaxID=266767 RepID=A0A6M2F993_9ROSI|nr:hypothetical protein NC651_009105 [Populus alba x Populus x berolinensis]
MDPRGLAPYSCPGGATVNTQGESRIPGRSQEQKGKKRKNDFGKHGKAFKKRKEGVKQVLNSVGKQIQRLTKKIENQENSVDKLLHHQMTLGSEVFEQLKEESAILCPDSNNLDVLILETKKLSDIILPLKDRSKMLDKRIQLLCEMMVLR